VILAHTIEKAVSICVKVIEVPVSQRGAATSALSAVGNGKGKKGKSGGAVGASALGSANISPDEEHEIATSALHQLMRLITWLCVDNFPFQKTMFTGAKSSILLKLCQLPVRYITNELFKVHLLPALAVLCLDCSSNFNLYKREMSPAVIIEYMSKALAFVSNAQLTVSGEAPSGSGQTGMTTPQTERDSAAATTALAVGAGVGVDDEADKRRVMVELSRRIPVQFWPVIIEYFST